MTATNGQTGTAESTGAAQVAPPPFHVPAGSACVDDCDDAPLGWSSPAVGAANLPAEAQGGGGDMIGCWQVAQTADPHGDSETSDEDEIMQLYVSADGAGGNHGLWFRVRDGSFSGWASMISPLSISKTLSPFVAATTVVHNATQLVEIANSSGWTNVDDVIITFRNQYIYEFPSVLLLAKSPSDVGDAFASSSNVLAFSWPANASVYVGRTSANNLLLGAPRRSTSAVQVDGVSLSLDQ